MSDSIFFKRKSKRAFEDREVPEDVLEQLFEIVRWSPSCNNNQPWRFVFVTDKEKHAECMTALPKGNQWAAAAPVFIALCAREKDDHSRDDDPVKYYQFDSGQACLSLLLGAVEFGLMGHAMAGYDAHKLHDILDIPEEFHVQCVIALGYPGSIDQLDEKTRKKDEAERTRKPVSEIIARNRFDFEAD